MSFSSGTRTPPQPQPFLQPTVPPDVWFGPAPAAADLRTAVSSSHAPRTIQLFQGHLMDPSFPQVGANVRATFKDVFPAMAAAGHKLAIEAPAVKPYSTTDKVMDDVIAQARQALDAAIAFGWPVSELVIDEPLTGSLLGTGAEVVSHDEAVRLTAKYITAIRASHPETAVGLVEGFQVNEIGVPVPSYPKLFDVYEPIRFCDRLREAGAAPAFLHMDVDWWVCRRGSAVAAQQLRQVQAFAADTVRNMAFGVVVTGHGQKDADWVSDARDLFGWYRSVFGSNWPARVDVESWGQDASKAFTVPSAAAQLSLTSTIRAALGSS